MTRTTRDTADATRDTADATQVTSDGLAGPQVVLVLYAVLVAVGGVAGVLVATFVSGLSRPELFGVIPLPATTAGFALFGAITIAVVLGVPLAGVIYVSRRIDTT